MLHATVHRVCDPTVGPSLSDWLAGRDHDGRRIELIPVARRQVRKISGTDQFSLVDLADPTVAEVPELRLPADQVEQAE